MVQAQHVKTSVNKALLRRTKSICSDEVSLNQELTNIKKTMQLNGYPSSVINKTIKETLQGGSSVRENQEMEQGMMARRQKKKILQDSLKI